MPYIHQVQSRCHISSPSMMSNAAEVDAPSWDNILGPECPEYPGCPLPQSPECYPPPALWPTSLVSSPLCHAALAGTLPPELMSKKGWLHSTVGAIDLDVFASTDPNSPLALQMILARFLLLLLPGPMSAPPKVLGKHCISHANIPLPSLLVMFRFLINLLGNPAGQIRFK